MTPQEFRTSFVEQPADILNRDDTQLLKPTHAKAGYRSRVPTGCRPGSGASKACPRKYKPDMVC
jgi:hypothetical protein